MSSKIDLTGQRFGRLVVINEAEPKVFPNGKTATMWLCKCDCGTVKAYNTQALRKGLTNSCGCYHHELIKADYSGKKFGNLTVIEECGRTKSRGVIWLCKCDCGNYYKAISSSLKNGTTTSCGCKTKEKRMANYRGHGMSRTRLYKIWMDMKTRCNNPNTPYFSKYGGRGIKVCDEWNDFETFRDWAIANGYKDDLTIDRINVDGNYESSNCRWATAKVQSNNKRNNRFITFNGTTKTVSEWADDLGMKPRTLLSRLDDYHWTIEKTLSTPVHKYERRIHGTKNSQDDAEKL